MKDREEAKATPARHRHRATRACTQCRKARVRCVLDSDSSTCVPCRNSQQQCVFDEKDGRKCRVSVKSVEATLTERIRVLERQLEEERSRSRALHEGAHTGTSAVLSDQVGDDVSRGGLSPETASLRSVALTASEGRHATEDEKDDSDEPASSVVTKLMPSSIRFDMASGRVRYFGSTTHMNVLTKVTAKKGIHRRQDAHWPIALVLKDLAPATHDYLMDLFWENHNSVIRLVDREAYHHDQETGGVEYYSTFLHLAILATGFRYADRRRPDIQKLALSEHVTSTIHEKTKALGKQELERPGGIPSIQALQLLAGLEFCCSNDDTGWMFQGMCFRMVYDAGLHIDHASLGISKRDTQIRHMVLWACLTADRLWSLYLGRPTTLKTSDISPSCLTYVFDESHSLSSLNDVDTRIYEAMLQMMERVGQLCDLRGPRPARSAESRRELSTMGQHLRDWYAELSPDLRWSDDLTMNMPPSYFLLHTQYHAALILLHRPFIQYDEKSSEGVDSQFRDVCRTTCSSSAERIAIVLEEYRARFEPSQVFGTAVQHAGTAATALMGEVVIQANPVERSRLIQRLSSLKAAVGFMARNYRGAGLMANVIDQFIRSVTKRSDMSGAEAHAPLAHYQAQQYEITDQVGQSGQFVEAQGPSMIGNALQQRWRPDSWSTFAPLPAGHLSPAGLPFLPSSFLEGVMEDEFAFGEFSASGETSGWGNGSMGGFH